MLQAALKQLDGLTVIPRAASPQFEAAAHQQKHRGGCPAQLEITGRHPVVVVGVWW